MKKDEKDFRERNSCRVRANEIQRSLDAVSKEETTAKERNTKNLIQ